MSGARLAELSQIRPALARINATQSAKLAGGVAPAGVGRQSAGRIVELLIRVSKGRAATHGVERSTSWIARELRISSSTVLRAIDELISHGVVVLAVPGGGQTRAQYLVNIELLHILRPRDRGELDAPIFTPLNHAVHPGEPTQSEPDPQWRNATPPVAKRHPTGSETPPPYAGARSLSRFSSLYPPSPPEQSASPPSSEASPAAGGRDPLDRQSPPEAKCRHGRTRSQGGCRPCGTTGRDDAKAAQLDQVETQTQQRAEELARRHAAETKTRAESVRPPADWRKR